MLIDTTTTLPRVSLPVFIALVFLVYSSLAFSWGHDGHSAVGVLAVEQLRPEVGKQLLQFMGSLDDEAMEKACNWPDEVRETKEWEWTYPLHYINVPRGDFQYLQSRDCPDQLCATEAIKRYATELGDVEASTEKRWQAFAWLCHLTGDLHQPLHAGFADDRGGNNYEVVFRDKQTNLHSLWDSKLIESRINNVPELIKLLGAVPESNVIEFWSPVLVNSWTNESHELAKQQVYPASIPIDEAYEAASWKLIQKRLNLSAIRLALIINSTLKKEQ